MRYSAAEIEKRRNESREAGCSGPALWWNSPAELLRGVCNGCGAEDAPQWVRDALTWVYRNYPHGHMIHDCDFEESDGSESGLDVANDRFNANNVILWIRRWGKWRWIRPRALIERNNLRLAYKAVCWLGNDAWQAAYQRNLAREVAENE